MSRIHLIVDVSYLYHRHLYSVREGKRKRLSAIVDGKLVDTTMLYFTLMDLEAIRRRWITACNELVVSVCFDSKSERKNESADYKSNRNALGEEDFDNFRVIQEIVTSIGYNVYKAPGMEADDIVTSLVNSYKNLYDFTVVYTPDSDLLVNIDKNVGVMRYKSSLASASRGRDVMNQAHMAIGVNNYSQVIGEEWECCAPLNITLLFKCTCGDKADKVAGIKGFGPAAFNSYVRYLINDLGFTAEQFEELTDANKVKEALERSANYLGEVKLQQALDALELVRFRQVAVDEPSKRDSDETRAVNYGKYSMASLID